VTDIPEPVAPWTMALRRKTRTPDPDHPEPVEIDLGLLMDWQVHPVVASLKADGHRVELVSQSETARHGGTDHHRLLVHADDVGAVRAELAEAELL
jgi:hypothetical protein